MERRGWKWGFFVWNMLKFSQNHDEFTKMIIVEEKVEIDRLDNEEENRTSATMPK